MTAATFPPLQQSFDFRGERPAYLDVDTMFKERWQLPTPVPVLSLFSGAGFLDLGFENAGFEVVYRNEYNRVFAAASEFAYAGMHSDKSISVDHQSILDVGPSVLMRRGFGRNGRPPVFGVIGGPPCPDFSVGGKNRGGEGDRGKLTAVFVERVLEIRPSFFVLENVKGLISTKKHREFLNSLVARLSEHYVVSQRVLNSLDVGVPQDRERVFVIGILKRGLPRSTQSGRRREPYLWPRSHRYFGAKTAYPWPTTSPFGADSARPALVPLDLTVWGSIGDLDLIRRLPNGEDMFLPRSKKFLSIPEGDDRRKSFKRLHRWRYSPTAAYGNNEVHLHPTLPRRISVREALRLQTVPDEYAFPPSVPLSAKFKMVGNGVPVRLAQAVAYSVGHALFASGSI